MKIITSKLGIHLDDELGGGFRDQFHDRLSSNLHAILYKQLTTQLNNGLIFFNISMM